MTFVMIMDCGPVGPDCAIAALRLGGDVKQPCDVISNTGRTNVSLRRQENRATAMGNMQKYLLNIGSVVPEI